MTVEGIIAAGEVEAEGWCNRARERCKRSIDQLQSVNGHRLDPIADSQSEWVRCHECGRTASAAIDTCWTNVSCNTNRWVGGEAAETKAYGNLKAARGERGQRQAICDAAPGREITAEDKSSIEANKAQAFEKQAKIRRTANVKAEAVIRNEAEAAVVREATRAKIAAK